MGSGFSKRKKQAKALQAKIAEMQEQLTHVEAEGSAGNGLVTVVLSGDHELKSIRIKPECVDPEDVEGLEDLIAVAFKDAASKLNQQSDAASGSVAQLMGGGLPDLGSLGF